MKNSLIPAILLAAMAISCKGDNSKTAAPKDPVKVKVIRVEKNHTNQENILNFTFFELVH